MSSSTQKLLSWLSLVSSLIGILLMVLFFLTAAGSGVLYTGLVAGIVGIVLGAVALVKRQAKGLAVSGIVLGSVTVIATIGIVIFALVFIGAIVPPTL